MEAIRSMYWTKPGEIDGTPEEVREVVIKQLGDFAAIAAEIVEESAVQIRSADLGDILSRSGPRSDQPALEEWFGSDRGIAVVAVRNATGQLVRSVAALIRTYR